MSDQYVGEIRMFSGGYAPQGWHVCDGSILPVNGNEALFSLLGATYGGDGRTNFGLPDLRGRVLVHRGTLNSTTYTQGQKGGSEQVTLQPAELAAHTHPVNAQSAVGANPAPTNGFWGQAQIYTPTATATMSSGAVSIVGGGSPHNNVMPFGVVTFIIALSGNYPSQF